jgi:hypothetical protein
MKTKIFYCFALISILSAPACQKQPGVKPGAPSHSCPKHSGADSTHTATPASDAGAS